MAKNIRVGIRVTQADHDRWNDEATKRNKSISDFIRDCVDRVLGGIESDRVMDKLDAIQEGLDVKAMRAEIISLHAAINESMAIIDGKKAELLRLARETSNPDDNKHVFEFVRTNGRVTLDVVTSGTGMEKSDVYKALQVLVELGSVTCNANKHPTTWEVRS